MWKPDNVKLIFAGTPSFAAAALTALHHAGHEIALVLTQPDRPSGRGMKLNPSAVAAEATRLALPLDKPAKLSDPRVQATLQAIEPEVMVVAAYGLLLPQAVLDIPRRGCINIHGSLLPRWRGAAPASSADRGASRRSSSRAKSWISRERTPPPPGVNVERARPVDASMRRA